MIRERGNGFYEVGDLICSMWNEGYEIEGKGEVNGELIKHVDFLHYISIEFKDGKLLFVPYEKVNWITIKEVDGY